ncbi:polyprenyl synthetase family protein [Rickettsiales bacterium]|nr:polyprenyl synthetase family protein [Rickettsiales bacterium]
MNDFQKYLSNYSNKITKEILNLIVVSSQTKTSLYDAIRYVIEVGGKRLRPILVLEFCKIFKVNYSHAIRVASSIELIHCYSLVHDDLPSMDDDDLRRGNPTCHIKFDEATAILVGDALQCYAFQILSDKKTHNDAEVRSKLIFELSKSSGLNGMVGGQKMDLEAEKKKLNLDEVKLLQKLKTGELFRFSCISACVLAKEKEENFKKLEKYAYNLGLAFQIQDDLLDVIGDENKVGKKINKDSSMGKQTFISVLGIDEAKKKAETLIDEAIDIINSFGKDSEVLVKLTKLIINRTH